MEFSVLISVYSKENPKFFDEALKSTLVNQSVTPNEVVIVKDGPLTDSLDAVIETYKEAYSSIVKVVELETNKGLGEALKIGVQSCSFDIIARMDSDDINDKLRFEKQLSVFKENSEIALVGTNIAEFFGTKNKIEFVKKVPVSLDEIKKMAIRRNPINHVSVMFKKKAVLDSGNYKHLYYLEDYYLWIRMLAQGYILKNISETLVYVRTGEGMFKRRSNPQYIKSWLLLQREMKKYSLISNKDFLINMINIVGFIYMPVFLKKHLYKFFLREAKME